MEIMHLFSNFYEQLEQFLLHQDQTSHFGSEFAHSFFLNFRLTECFNFLFGVFYLENSLNQL